MSLCMVWEVSNSAEGAPCDPQKNLSTEQQRPSFHRELGRFCMEPPLQWVVREGMMGELELFTLSPHSAHYVYAHSPVTWRGHSCSGCPFTIYESNNHPLHWEGTALVARRGRGMARALNLDATQTGPPWSSSCLQTLSKAAVRSGRPARVHSSAPLGRASFPLLWRSEE